MSDPTPAGLADVPVFLGGPVGTNQLMFASFDWEGRDSLSLDQNVVIDEAHQLAEQDRGTIRAFVGYAGWTAGQLENELRQDASILRKPDRAALVPERLPRLWFEIMRSLGPWFKMLPRRRMIPLWTSFRGIKCEAVGKHMIIVVPKRLNNRKFGLLYCLRQRTDSQKRTQCFGGKKVGLGSGYLDSDYMDAGARIIDSARDSFQQARDDREGGGPLPIKYKTSCARDKIYIACLHTAASRAGSGGEPFLSAASLRWLMRRFRLESRLPLLEPIVRSPDRCR